MTSSEELDWATAHLLEQIATYPRQVHRDVANRMSDIRFCLDTGRRQTAIELARQVVVATPLVSRYGVLKREIDHLRHLMTLPR